MSRTRIVVAEMVSQGLYRPLSLHYSYSAADRAAQRYARCVAVAVLRLRPEARIAVPGPVVNADYFEAIR